MTDLEWAREFPVILDARPLTKAAGTPGYRHHQPRSLSARRARLTLKANTSPRARAPHSPRHPPGRTAAAADGADAASDAPPSPVWPPAATKRPRPAPAAPRPGSPNSPARNCHGRSITRYECDPPGAAARQLPSPYSAQHPPTPTTKATWMTSGRAVPRCCRGPRSNGSRPGTECATSCASVFPPPTLPPRSPKPIRRCSWTFYSTSCAQTR